MDAAMAQIFVETSYEVRDFQSLAYTLPSDVKTLPADLPRSLSTNGLVVNFGVEITFPKKPEPQPSVAPSPARSSSVVP
jgi:hypothetical protein